VVELVASQSRAINEVRVVDMLDSGVTNQLGTGRQHREVLSSTSSMKADLGQSDPMGRSTGCSLLIACMVFSGVEDA